jgi:DNA-binding MarR family transcriptional regulator
MHNWVRGDEMDLLYLLQPRVWGVLKELSWGDRFERDLEEKISKIKADPQGLAEIRDKLLEMGLVYRLRGGDSSPYLALTYKGQNVVGRIIETEEILQSDDAPLK